MNDERQPPEHVTQLNLGAQARIAGRDYHERRIPDSMKVYLATTPSDQLDREAVDNERLFRYRFGWDLPMAVRQQVIDIRKTYGLTDLECRWLRRSSQMQVSRKGAKLQPDRLMPLVGWFYLLIIVAACLACVLTAAHAPIPPWTQMLAELVIAVGWLGVMWLVVRLFIAPWRWLGQVGAR